MIAIRISPWDARFAHAPIIQRLPPEIRAFFVGLAIGGYCFFSPFFKVSKTMEFHAVPSAIWKIPCWFPAKNRWGTQMGDTGWAQPNLCQIASFSPNFFGWWKMSKKQESLKFHPIQIGWLHPIPLEKEVSPEKLSQRSDFTLSCLATRGTRFVGTRTDLKTLSQRPYFGGGRGNWPNNTQPKFEGKSSRFKSRYPHGKYSC